ncbi:MAG: BsuPI-related putative proteinase inhibitor [Verrucomicrobiota bacterium]
MSIKHLSSWLPVCFLAFVIFYDSLWAVDIRPARQTVPDRFINPPGKRFSLFKGDPARVQKANEVNTDDFSAQLKIKEGVSISELEQGIDEDVQLELQFIIQNESERQYTLSFPDAQRYDIAITEEGTNNAIFVWSDDKAFMQVVGSVFVNPKEKFAYTINVPVRKLAGNLQTGNYTITAILSNYPEIKATTSFSTNR